MIPRKLEPEAMDTPEEANDYDAMDHSAVNTRFVADLLRAAGGPIGGPVLDVGTGTARIPIELCRTDPSASVVATDLAAHMLKIAERNLASAGLNDRIQLRLADAKRMGDEAETYVAVISNSIVHHIPDPCHVLAEMIRVLAPGGLLFVRDLIRPDSSEQVEWFVKTYAHADAPAAQALFRDSFYAALTLEEVRQLVGDLGADPDTVRLTSNRHWTWCLTKSG